MEEAARRFVLHPNTLREWRKRLETRPDVMGFFGQAPFNRIQDAVRWVVHEVRRLCPEREFGTRSIAMAIVRAGIQISRSSVQRFLREKPKPPQPKDEPSAKPVSSPVPYGILRPRAKNRAWHLDLVTLNFLWIRFYVAAIVDGFSRKLLTLRVYRDAPTTRDMVALAGRCIREFGAPRFLVTDHGAQFRVRFRKAVARWRTQHVRGRVRSCQFNGRVERFFRTFRLWQRLTLFAWKTPWIQRRLDSFRGWYNTRRPMWILGKRTPEEAWSGKGLPEAIPVPATDPVGPAFRVSRRPYRGDPRLPLIEITHRLRRTA